jgi:hypothetical protein
MVSATNAGIGCGKGEPKPDASPEEEVFRAHLHEADNLLRRASVLLEPCIGQKYPELIADIENHFLPI